LEKVMALDPDTKCRQKLKTDVPGPEQKIVKILPQPADYIT